MASKSLQAQKQQVLKVLDAKRATIQGGAHRLQESLKDLPAQAKAAGAQAKTKLPAPRNVTPATVGLSENAGVAKIKGGIGAIGGKAKSLLAKSEKAQKLQAKLPAIPEKIPMKPLMIGIGALLAVGALAGKQKKKKKLKDRKMIAQFKEGKQVAKYGAGVLLFKWLLSASQPAVKHYITKKVKKGLLG